MTDEYRACSVCGVHVEPTTEVLVAPKHRNPKLPGKTKAAPWCPGSGKAVVRRMPPPSVALPQILRSRRSVLSSPPVPPTDPGAALGVLRDRVQELLPRCHTQRQVREHLRQEGWRVVRRRAVHDSLIVAVEVGGVVLGAKRLGTKVSVTAFAPTDGGLGGERSVSLIVDDMRAAPPRRYLLIATASGSQLAELLVDVAGEATITVSTFVKSRALWTRGRSIYRSRVIRELDPGDARIADALERKLRQVGNERP